MTTTTVGNHQPQIRQNACELIRKVALAVVLGVCLAFAAAAAATAHGTTVTAGKPAEIASVKAGEATAGKPAETAAAQGGGEHAEAEEHGMFAGLLWPTVNFVILIGILWYFLNQPIATYLTDRHTAIRKELVEAANLKAVATAHLSEIDRKLQALPGVIDALKNRGAEEIAAEEQRIAGVAAAERDRLLEQTRREIELQVRLARRELVEHAADLAVQLATDRIKKNITPADQERLVDRYLQQVSDTPDARPDARRPTSDARAQTPGSN